MNDKEIEKDIEKNEKETKTSEEEIIEKRKTQILDFFKKSKIVPYVILAFIVWLGCFIRTRNLHLLKDVTTGKAIPLALDPFVFLRYAKYILNHGSLMAHDVMRYVPLGYNTARDRFLPYTIFYLHKIINIFTKTTLEHVDVIYPVVFFALAIIVFFFLIRKIFNSNVVAIISCLLLSIVPAFLYRTMAGFSDKEPLGIFLMFLSFYFFVSAFQSKKNKAYVYSLLTGISTAFLAGVWGGMQYVFMISGLTFIVFFLLNKVDKEKLISFGIFVFSSFFLIVLFKTKYALKTLLTSQTTGIVVFALSLVIFDLLIFKTKLKKIKISKIPPRVFSLVFFIILLLIFAFIFIGPSGFAQQLSEIKTGLLHPFGLHRLTLTVVENSQPYFTDWISSFSKIFFWIFFIGSVYLFYRAFSHFPKNYKYGLTLIFTLFLFGFIFSRYSSRSILNGVSFLSQFLYFGSLIMLVSVLFIIYIKTYNKNLEIFEDFKKIKFPYIFLLVWLIWMIISARGAIRLLFLLSPIACVTVSVLPEILFKKIKLSTGDKKILWIIVFIILILGLFFSCVVNFPEKRNGFIAQDYYQAKNTGPSANIQWQYAMNWVRNNIPEKSVFAHWWDYGYWVQTLGERPTILDGGNTIPYWDHLLGRHVLTAKTEEEALEFLKTHNASYLLIDPTDIGKYNAYSSIGSDENYDRESWIGYFNLDKRQTIETRNETTFVYIGGFPLDEDFIYKNKIYERKSGNVGIGALIIKLRKTEIGEKIEQPEAVLISHGTQIRVPIKCIYYNNFKYDFSGKNFDGFEGCIYIYPRIDGQEINKIGSALYISKRGMNALWTKLYLFNESENFQLVHSEKDPIIKNIEEQTNFTIGDFLNYAGFRGPIKIWKINYPENIRIKEEYLKTRYPKKELEIAKVK